MGGSNLQYGRRSPAVWEVSTCSNGGVSLQYGRCQPAVSKASISIDRSVGLQYWRCQHVVSEASTSCVGDVNLLHIRRKPLSYQCLRNAIVTTTFPGTLHGRISARISWSGGSKILLGETASLVCGFCSSVASRHIVFLSPSL